MTAQAPVLIVVDDEQGVLDVVDRLARRSGFEVVPCVGGLQALAQLGTRHADAALVDLRMPALGGLEVIRAIRETQTGRSSRPICCASSSARLRSTSLSSDRDSDCTNSVSSPERPCCARSLSA